MAQPDHSSDEEKVRNERRSCKVTCQQSEDEQHQVQERGHGKGLGEAYPSKWGPELPFDMVSGAATLEEALLGWMGQGLMWSPRPTSPPAVVPLR